MPVVYHDNVPNEPFRGGATYQTVVGDQQGSTPVRLGIQTSPPGYRTPLHSHPYMECLMILEGAGEAWIEGSDDLIALAPGMTLVFPANVRHQFRTLGGKPLKTKKGRLLCGKNICQAVRKTNFRSLPKEARLWYQISSSPL